jgi:hypothetical protein
VFSCYALDLALANAAGAHDVQGATYLTGVCSHGRILQSPRTHFGIPGDIHECVEAMISAFEKHNFLVRGRPERSEESI